MKTPTKQVIQRGTYANDGTGDTLRDAAQKINDNFTHLWNDTYDGIGLRPGREFSLVALSAEPDSGDFSVHTSALDVDSTQIIRISSHDQLDKSIKTSITTTINNVQLSMWSLDSGTVDDWNFLARYEGDVQYITTDKYWRFTKTSTLAATTTPVDSGGTYYIKIDGVM